MHRLLPSPTRCAALLAFAGALLVAGCDNSPSSVSDFEIQPALTTPSSLNLVVAGEDGASVDFTVQYQGLDEHPQLEASSGAVALERLSQTGTPSEGQQEWRATYTEAVDGVAEATITVRAPSGSEQVERQIGLTAAGINIQTDFRSTLATVADYEDEQRDSTATGGATIATTNAVAPQSNGLTALEVDAPASGGVTITREASAPNSDRFTFLLRPDPSVRFTLTLSFTEISGGSEVTRTFEVPVSAGEQWRKYSIPFEQIGEGLDPVAERAGGDGPFLRLDLTADANVSFAVDQLSFGTDGQALAEIDDFERTTLAYGPPFCPPTFSDSSAVAELSDGPTSRRVHGTPGCFGYNYQVDSGPALFLDATESGSLSFLASGSAEDSLEVFVETDGGAGGFGGGSSVTVALPEGGSWEQVSIPLTELGDDVSALRSAGITNVGFTAVGGEPDFLIDGVRLLASDSDGADE